MAAVRSIERAGRNDAADAKRSSRCRARRPAGHGSNGDFSRCRRFCLQPARLACGFCCGKRIDVTRARDLMRTTRHAARATPHRPACSPRAHSAAASPALPGLQNRHATSDVLRGPAHRTAARDHALRATGRAWRHRLSSRHATCCTHHRRLVQLHQHHACNGTIYRVHRGGPYLPDACFIAHVRYAAATDRDIF